MTTHISVGDGSSDVWADKAGHIGQSAWDSKGCARVIWCDVSKSELENIYIRSQLGKIFINAID